MAQENQHAHLPPALRTLTLRIAYANLFDARDVRRGSGTWYFLGQELERQGHTVHFLQPGEVELPVATRIFKGLSRRQGSGYRTFQDPLFARRLGRSLGPSLAGLDYDFLLTSDYGLAAYCPTERPVVLYTDSMISKEPAKRTNPRLAGLSPLSTAFSLRTIGAGLAKAAISIFPGRWQMREALAYDPDLAQRLAVVPFGANVDDPGAELSRTRSVTDLPKGSTGKTRLDLLFLGKDWLGKGGPLAVECCRVLRRQGYEAVLHAAGGEPQGVSQASLQGPSQGQSPDRSQDESVVYYGLLDKNRPKDLARLGELFAKCQLLVLPTAAEGFGLAFAEAAAHGLPVITHDTDGVNEIVLHEETGLLLPLGSSAIDFADAVTGLVKTPDLYRHLARASRRRYEENWTWKIATERLLLEIESRLPREGTL
ncbi:MAG: glycosyltransferase family 4 protein [Deltaproteobacteria bacterium]|nr:glycosyltransferase family 4 protein [Deltaproteobacteria bacterium]